jgi:uncharacterized repeat protein (TIGR03803 family)
MRVVARRLSLLVLVAVGFLASAPASGQTYEVLHAFEDAREPRASLVRGPDGAWYGTTRLGGAHGVGVVFRLSLEGSTWRRSIIHNFDGASGREPYAGLTVGPDQALYGTTSAGGPTSPGSPTFGGGTVYRLAVSGGAWTHEVVHPFNLSAGEGYGPLSGVVFGTDGAMYGTTQYGGLTDGGVVYRLSPDGTTWRYATLRSFDRFSEEHYPKTSLTLGPDGALYGTTSASATAESGGGAVFRLTGSGDAWALEVISRFPVDRAEGSDPGPLLVTSGPTVYGTTTVGGRADTGTAFRLTPSGSLPWVRTTLYTFDNTTWGGYYPFGALVLGADGHLYGATYVGGRQAGGSPGFGTVYRLVAGAPEWTAEILHTFDYYGGGYPYAGVAEDGGVLFGTTSAGGTGLYGTAFRLTESAGTWTHEVLGEFGGAGGKEPWTGLVVGSDGALYGTTQKGGRVTYSGGNGTIFRLAWDGAKWAHQVLHVFEPSSGIYPQGRLVVGPDGALYGTSNVGVFRFTEVSGSWAPTYLLAFDSSTSASSPGYGPSGDLTVDDSGALCGTTLYGGAGGSGTAYRLAWDGSGWAPHEIIHPFTGAEGSPSGGLTLGVGGSLYGAMSDGGAFSAGRVFRLFRDNAGTWQYESIHEFDNVKGANPIAAPLWAGGALYGTTYNGGAGSAGTVYRLAWDGTLQEWKLDVLHSFVGSRANPHGALISGPGVLYGTTTHGGDAVEGFPNGAGTVFRLTGNGASWDYQVLRDLSPLEGAQPTGSLVLSDGALYGTAYAGGPEGGGVVFRLVLPAAPQAQVSPASLTFAALNLGGTSAPQVVTVANAGGGVVQVTGATASGDFAVTNGCAAGVAAGATCDLQVRFVPTSEGERSGSLMVTTDAGGPFTVSLAGVGTVAAADLSPSSLTFGQVRVATTSATERLTLSSLGSGPVTLSSISLEGFPDFALSHDCPVAPATLAPGSVCHLDVAFTPTVLGFRSGTVTIVDDALGSPRVAPLSGEGTQPQATVFPQDLTFASFGVGLTGLAQGVTVTNTGTGTLLVSGAEASTNFVVTENRCTAGVGAGQACTIDVAQRATVSGPLFGTLTITTDGLGGTPVVNLSGTGAIATSTVAPTYVDFGTRAVGSTSPAQTVTVTAGGDWPLTIDTIAVTGAYTFSTTCPAPPMPVPTACTIDVAFAPTAAGPALGSLVITSNSLTTPQSVTLYGNAEVQTAQATVTPTSLTFAETPVGATTAPQTVTLQNTGTAPLSIAGIVADGDFARTTSCPPPPSTLPPGGSCGIDVTFTPTAQLLRTGSLTIAHDAPGSPAVVSLSGTGEMPPQATVPLMSLDFGQVRLGQPSAALPVTVTNTGGGVLTISNVTFESPGVPAFVLSGNTCGGGVPAGQSCTLSVSFTPFATGPAASILRIESNSAIPAASVGLSGTGTEPAVSLTPSALTFGAATIGASSPAKAVALQNSGTAPLAIAAIVAIGDFGMTSTCPQTPATLAPSASCEIAVTFVPTAPGARTGSLTVTTDAPGSPHVVPLTGEGAVVFHVSVMPASIDFGGVPVGESSVERFVKVTNAGVTALAVLSAATAPAAFTVSRSTCSAGLGAGGSCVIGVRLAPGIEGPVAGQLTVTADTETINIGLMGAGTQPTGARAHRPVAPEPGRFMWQTLQEEFVDAAGEACRVPVGLAVGDRVTCYSAPGGDLRCSGDVYQVHYEFGSPTGLMGVDQIMLSPTFNSADGNSLCVRKGDGTAWCMGGWNGSGQFGTGSTEPSADFVQWGGRNDIRRVGTGTSDQMCALTASDQVLCSGYGFGTTPVSVGSGTSFYVTEFGTVLVDPPVDRASPGRAECTVVGGALACPGHMLSSSMPVVDGGPRGYYGQDYQEYCLLNSGGTIECTVFSDRQVRVEEYFALSDALALATNGYTRRICAVRRDGSIWCADGGPGTEVEVQPAGSVSLSCMSPTAPVAQVEPLPLAFGSANVGQTSGTQSVTVSNAGGGVVNLTGVSVTGDFQVTNGCTGGVAGGASCSIQVAFVPALAGLRAGILTITTDAGGPFTVALSGTGTAPVVTLEPASLGFGAVAVGVPSAPKSATLTNTGDGPLTIGSIATTGDYAMTTGCPLAPATLAAGAGCTVSVTFTPMATGSRPGTLTITDDAAGSPRTVNLTGSGATVDASPSPLGFGGVPVDTTAPTKTVTIINSTAGATAISSISVTAGATDYTQTNGCPATLAAGETCVVTVTFRPGAVGSRPGKLGIVYGSTTLTVNLSGSGTFNLGVTPGSLTFAKQAIATTSAAKTVTLTNANGRAINFTGITSVAEFPVQSNGCGTLLAAGATCTVTVAFSPTATGTRTGQLTIADDATGNPHKVNLSGTGTLPLTVSPTSLGFGSVVAGVTSAAKTVTLTNANPEAITFASITASGDYALTNGCPAVLAPSASCTLTLTFTPTAKGSRPAVLDILSDATSSPQKVNLNGTGTLPLNTTGGLSFGSVVAGVTSAAKTITLSNPSPTLPITLSPIAASGDFAATDTCGGIVAPSGSCAISVTFTPTVTGSRSGKVTAQSDATNNPRTVNLSGTGTQPLTVAGGPVAFGNVAVGATSAPKTVTLINSSPLLAIPVTSIATTGDFAQTNDCGVSIPAGGSCSVTLTFGPTATGNRTGQLTVTSGATTSPNRVNLSGRGI